MKPSSSCHGSEGGAGDAGEGAKACRNTVDRIVKQSLDRKIKSIMQRATTFMDMTTNPTKLLQELSLLNDMHSIVLTIISLFYVSENLQVILILVCGFRYVRAKKSTLYFSILFVQHSQEILRLRDQTLNSRFF
jgi:hypothetical protein